MRLVTFEHQGTRRLGVRTGDAIVDLSQADASLPTNMRDFLAAGENALNSARTAADKGEHAISASDVKICAPIHNPEKVICIGLNYADHAAESGMPIPPEPVVFSKYASCIINPGDNIVAPSVSNEVDYEVELVVIIGKAGRNIPKSDALNHVAGYTVGHDVSARDYQLQKPGGQWMLGKTFDTFAPLGPDLVTPDEVGDPGNLDIRCSLNGEIVQSSNTSQLIFNIETLISYLSHVFTLTPGDIIFTGTPSGVGMGRTPQVWLKEGDVVVCEIDGLGRLENPVVSD
ncbi:MAG: 2-keto-4-pentenoate hydratase/2-oxohepta-3-ene-1,7-dioic acid hydratase in catechol pathway [Candidatus Latescibacterota bacterium]|jgi:2-keto-4-pentenoate hydratase/2-oxohepta-3-ene-1,7-dioic acid hydratase in catechol pathway